MMKYRPRFAVWELTNACNAKCLHCGSQSGHCRENELTLEEALNLCDQLKEAGCEGITLIGGEFFLNPYWEEIARKLVENGIRVSPLTNGLLLNEKNIAKLKSMNIMKVGMSLDGVGQTHDHIRGVPNIFDRIIENLKLAQKEGLNVAIVTAVSALNIHELPAIYEYIKGLDVTLWQIQAVEDIGNANKNTELSLTPAMLYIAAKFIATARRKSDMRIITGDNIGYFTSFEPALRDEPFTGCMAGRLVVGIDASGNVRGCLSVYNDPANVEGNIRERTLKEIWEDPNRFTTYRSRPVEKLTGFCAKCKYNNLCRGGCSSMAYSLTGTFTENPFCLYKYETEQGMNAK